MLEAVAKVKNAVASKSIVPQLTWYVIYDNMIHAADGRIVAAAPFPCKETFAVPAVQFDNVLSRLEESGEDIKLSLTDGSVNLSAGKFRGRVLRYSTDKVHFPEPSGKRMKAPPDLVSKFAVMRPFISDNATQQFALCLCLRGDRIMATNNVALVITDESGLPPSVDIMLPCWAVDFVLSRREQSLSYLQYDSASISFHWDDGSWMRSAILAVPFPNIEPLIEKVQEPDFEITKEWRKAYSIVAGMSELSIRIFADKIVGGTTPLEGSAVTTAEVEAQIESPIPEGREYSAWNPEFLTPVIERANFWKPDCFPQAAPFAGDDIYGVIMGRARD